MSVHFQSLKMDWPTPREFFAGLDAEFGFSLDVCASSENACTVRFFTERDEGLMRPWTSENVWCNPPYGRQIARWMEKCWTESPVASVVVALVPSRTDTAWWHEYVMRADEIRFVRGRLKFGGQAKDAPFPSAVVVWR